MSPYGFMILLTALAFLCLAYSQTVNLLEGQTVIFYGAVNNTSAQFTVPKQYVGRQISFMNFTGVSGNQSGGQSICCVGKYPQAEAAYCAKDNYWGCYCPLANLGPQPIQTLIVGFNGNYLTDRLYPDPSRSYQDIHVINVTGKPNQTYGCPSWFQYADPLCVGSNPYAKNTNPQCDTPNGPKTQEFANNATISVYFNTSAPFPTLQSSYYFLYNELANTTQNTFTSQSQCGPTDNVGFTVVTSLYVTFAGSISPSPSLAPAVANSTSPSGKASNVARSTSPSGKASNVARSTSPSGKASKAPKSPAASILPSTSPLASVSPLCVHCYDRCGENSRSNRSSVSRFSEVCTNQLFGSIRISETGTPNHGGADKRIPGKGLYDICCDNVNAEQFSNPDFSWLNFLSCDLSRKPQKLVQLCNLMGGNATCYANKNATTGSYYRCLKL